jgi:hypothetical protein
VTVLARGEVDVDVLFHGAGHKHCFDGEPLRLDLRGGAALASLMSECVLVGYWYFLGIGSRMGSQSCQLCQLNLRSWRYPCYAWYGTGWGIAGVYRSLKKLKIFITYNIHA